MSCFETQRIHLFKSYFLLSFIVPLVLETLCAVPLSAGAGIFFYTICMNELSDNALNQLFKMNYPIRYNEGRYTIDVKATPNCSGGLRFKCPFCLKRKTSIIGYKPNGMPYANSMPMYHNHGKEYGTRANHCSDEAKSYYGLVGKNFEFNLCEDVKYVPSLFK